MSNAKSRVACFVDGFNLYHAINELRDQRGKPLHHLKWVDLQRLTNLYIKQADEEVVAVYYFSAIAAWLPDASARHRNYIAALEHSACTIKLGNFKTKQRSCKNCGTCWDAHEEKETDVNLALELLQQGWLDSYDKAIIMTADTDIVPAIKMVRSQFPGKELVAAIPEKRYGHALALRHNCTQSLRIKQAQIAGCLFPDSITKPDGQVIIRPGKYTPPAK